MEDYSKEESPSLKHEVASLSEVNQRLTRELRRYQLSAPKDPQKFPDSLIDEGLPPWAANVVLMSPLLMAYDNRVHELEVSLDRSRSHLEEMTETIKKLTAENSALRDEMERKWREMIEKEKKGLDSGFMGMSFHVEEKNELQNRLDLQTTENTILLEKLDIFKKRNEFLEAFAREKDEIAEKNVYEAKQLKSELRNLQMIEEDVRAQKEIAEDKLKRASERLGTLEREREQQITDLNKMQNDLRIIKQQSEHYKNAFEDIEAKKTEEIEILVQDAHNFSAKEKEIANKSLMQERELEEAKEQAFHYKREFESIRSECDNILKVMEDYEQKIVNYQQKEESVNALIRESKQKVEEAYLERDRVLLKEQQYQKNIEKLQEALKHEMKDQRDKYEGLLEGLRSKNRAMIQKRDEEIQELQGKVILANSESDRAIRDVALLKSENNKLENLLEEEQRRSLIRFNEYDKKFRENEESRVSEKRVLEMQTHNVLNERNDWERIKKNQENSIAAFSREIETLKASLKRNREDGQRLENQKDDLLRERESLIREVGFLKEDLFVKVEEVKEVYSAKINSLEAQLQEVRDRHRESEEKAYELYRAQEKVSEKWKTEHMSTVGYFEKLIQDQNFEIRRLAKRNKDLGDSFPIKEMQV
jgi:chromosome segregation ATPase